MSKTYTAVFIGGYFDMTKRILSREEKEFSFFEPPDPNTLFRHSEASAEDIPCRRIIYEMVGRTPSGVLIYDYRKHQ